MSEFALAVAVADYLRTVLDPSAATFFHVANERRASPRQGAMLKRMGVVAGVADIALLWTPGRIGFLELKIRGKSLSPAQREWGEWCGILGVPFAKATSIEDVENFLSANQVPTRISRRR